VLKAKTIVISVVAFLMGSAATVLFIRGGDKAYAGGAARPEIIFYSEPDFQGRAFHFFESTLDLPYEEFADGSKFLWNDNIKSFIVVSGTWRLYQHGRLNTSLDDTPPHLLDVRTKVSVKGWSTLVSATSRGPLYIASPELGGIDLDISSIELVSEQNLPDWAFRAR
jgi:hypothetical protein